MIGSRMREARELCNLSQIAAAKRFGYANSSKLAKVEKATDTKSVPLWLIIRASEVYEVSIDFLFGIMDDWETGARMMQEREVSTWLFDAFDTARQRDMETLKKLHDRLQAMSEYTNHMIQANENVSAALDMFIEMNKGFDDYPGGARLVRSIRLITDATKLAKLKLDRFKTECVLAAGDTRQLSLLI
ncbi:MAG: helix-turn-helix domain-containing protein [Alistipes senegalensis]|nr:helix-turn-helix domain-containing protein [Oxalobacter formigenes]MCM1280921.1 helix-turn-helix domain-containing protein [Alistipes senegalensis]